MGPKKGKAKKKPAGEDKADEKVKWPTRRGTYITRAGCGNVALLMTILYVASYEYVLYSAVVVYDSKIAPQQ